MLHFLDLRIDADRPWLILGKGPSFRKLRDIDRLEYYTLGLNEVAQVTKVDLAHCIDLECISYSMDCSNLIMPWHPHIKCKVQRETLKHFAGKATYLGELNLFNRLYYYYCSTWKGKQPCVDVKVKYFSAEAAFQILIQLGVKEIHSLGIDGGTEYAPEFLQLGLKPLKNGRSSFDEQFSRLNQIITESGITYRAL